MDDEPARETIGKRLRAYRKLKRLRLHELAVAAGCSESLVSRIENGLVMPSLSSLHRLSRALGVNVANLLEPPCESAFIVFAPGQRPTTSVGRVPEGDGSSAECLMPYAENRLLEGLLVSLPPGGPVCGPFSHEGEEVGFVLHGVLELTVDGVVRRVPAEHSFFFISNLVHTYRNGGETLCRVLWVNTPPTF
jgi:quercetin dioxygenase-like cupin family protein/DNA-binding XRE family transcriptional regulator